MSPPAKLHLGPKRRIALIYNAYEESSPESRTDHGGMWHLRQLVRSIARALRRLGHQWIWCCWPTTWRPSSGASCAWP
jgi:hypothetical protein